MTALRRSLLELRHEVNGLRAAHHETRVLADEAVRRAAVATDVIAAAAWIEAQRVDTDLLISVIMPTHNRAHLLPTAIASVLEQTYPNLEIVVVDDGSTDDTASVLDQLTDPRVRLVTNRTNLGEAASRNLGLDNAHGDIVCFLDDDNTFHRDWLRSVVWLFHTHRDTEVAYGARLVDDVDRHRSHESGGLPFLELNEWDESINRERCLIDINVLAHRSGPVRFDRALPLFTDWVYLRELTREVTPVRLPVIATRYTTDSPDRVTFAQRHRHDELYHLARSAGTDPTDGDVATSV